MQLLLAIFLLVVPGLDEGRIRPVSDVESAKVLPLAKDPAVWISLDEWNGEATLYDGTNLSEAYAPFAGERFYSPSSGEIYFPSLFKLQIEQFYTQMPLVLILIGLYLLSALLKGRFFWIPFAFHTALLLMRIYILERPPVATMYETLLFVPWISSAFSLILNKKPLRIIGALLAAALLYLSTLAAPYPSLENIQPVLRSNFWLTIHVQMVVASYGLFILAGVMAHLWLLKVKREQLIKPMIVTLYLGVIFLIVGTILGGIWASMSWGRFWDWDPKESWALISSATYLVLVHLYRFGKIGPFGLSIGAIIGLLSITFTWYGVNYLLGTGLHSYGFSSGGKMYYLIYFGAELLFIFGCLFTLLDVKGQMKDKLPH